MWNHCKIATGTSLLRRSVYIHCQMTLPCKSKVNLRLHRKSPLQTISIRFPKVKELLKMNIIFPIWNPNYKNDSTSFKNLANGMSIIWTLSFFSIRWNPKYRYKYTYFCYIIYICIYIHSIHTIHIYIYTSVPDLWNNARSWFFCRAYRGSWRWSCQERDFRSDSNSRVFVLGGATLNNSDDSKNNLQRSDPLNNGPRSNLSI